MEAALLIVGVLTLLITGVTLYRTSFRPARLVLERVPTQLEWGRAGGVNSVPPLHEVRLRLAASNTGARLGVLERLEVDDLSVVGTSELATEATAGRIDNASTPTPLSAVIDPGESRQFDFTFEFAGLARTTFGTQPTPDLEPLATELGALRSLSFVVLGTYHRSVRFLRKQRETKRVRSPRIELPVEQAQKNAAQLWADSPQTAHLADLACPQGWRD